MSGLDLNALDRWITDGRYSKRFVLVTCPACGEKTEAVYEEEYGAGDISPSVCGSCGEDFPSSLDMEDDEGPEPEPPDRWDDGPDDRDVW